jgi:hypothetical protein
LLILQTEFTNLQNTLLSDSYRTLKRSTRQPTY